jgi:catechol 2,3-dioxygenase-like lactoylglutathione lyase family enzyme
MRFHAKNIRTFIGAKNYEISRAFYQALGYEEIELSDNMCLFKVNDSLGFYLQNYYVKNWVENSMIFLEVDDIEICEQELLSKVLPGTFKGVKISKITSFDWGREIFLHDPSGVLWHYCQFGDTISE